VRVPHLSPTTLTTDEQRLILMATAGNVRDHTIISLALGTGLRLAEVVGLDVGDVFAPDGTPRARIRARLGPGADWSFGAGSATSTR
jgi:integrase